ncbi:MAG: cardiolipin synthase [Oscillospiraceae bacterium]|nr:cardiolipin synthase [Oscillospiraceae bacterium]
MKRIIRFLMSKSFLFGALAILQVGFLLGIILKFAHAGSYLYTVITIVSVLLCIILFEKDDINPAYKMMWIAIVILLPITGAIFYIMWGNRKLSKKTSIRFQTIEANARSVMVRDNHLYDKLSQNSMSLLRCSEYLTGSSGTPLYTDTYSEYFPWGEVFFERFLEELKQAKKCIFMEYFIVDEGYMWDTTLDILKEKVQEGVDVRIIFDSFGTMFTLPNNYEVTLRKYGIKSYPFNPIHFSAHLSDYTFLNHRDHRKICIIDNEIGFTGGLNFADEYINKRSPYGIWKDTALMLKGPGAYSLTVTFLKMWAFVSGEDVHYEDFRPVTRYPVEDSFNFVQPYDDSPLDGENVAENAYFNIINSAKKYVYIATPYLIIDHEMMVALTLAAKSGVDVRLMTPGIPDKKYVYYLTQAHYPELLKAGVRIFEYTPGFVHCKMYVSDDKTAIVGSANMDYRSLYLHFENCCAFYGGDVVDQVKQDMITSFEQCREITLEDTRRTPFFKRILQVVFRFFAPLM